MEEALTKAEQKKAQKLIEETLKLLDIDGGVELTEKDGSLDVLLTTEDSGRVIGYHGEGLEALQLILSLMLTKKFGRFVRITLDIGEYRKNRTEYLEKLAAQVKDRVLEDGHEQTLSNLKSWERRVIHMILKDDNEVTSESMGQGRDRVLVVRPR